MVGQKNKPTKITATPTPALTPAQQAAVDALPVDLHMMLALALGFALGEYDNTGDGKFNIGVSDLLRGLSDDHRNQLAACLRAFVDAPDALSERFEVVFTALRQGMLAHPVNERLLKSSLVKLAERRAYALRSFEVLNLARAFQCGNFPPDFHASEVHFEIAILNCMANLSREKREKHAEILQETNNDDDAAMSQRTARMLDVLASGESTDPADIALRAAARWDRAAMDMTARQHFEAHFAQIPRAHRPWAHIVRARARRYYDALAKHQSNAGRSLDDLFPIDPSAAGPKPLLPPEAARDRAREKNRLRVAAFRARQKQEPT